MTIKEMKELYMDKALKKYKTIKKAAEVLGISACTLENYNNLKNKKK